MSSIWRPGVRDLEWRRVASPRRACLSCPVSSRLVSCRALLLPSQQQFPSLFFSFSTIFWTSGHFFFPPFSSFFCSENRAFPVSISSNFSFSWIRVACVGKLWSGGPFASRENGVFQNGKNVLGKSHKRWIKLPRRDPLCSRSAALLLACFWGGCCYCFCCFNPRAHSFPFSGNSFLFCGNPWTFLKSVLFDHFFLNNAVYRIWLYPLVFFSFVAAWSLEIKLLLLLCISSSKRCVLFWESFSVCKSLKKASYSWVDSRVCTMLFLFLKLGNGEWCVESVFDAQSFAIFLRSVLVFRRLSSLRDSYLHS